MPQQILQQQLRCLHMPAYVSIRQHPLAYVSVRVQMPAQMLQRQLHCLHTQSRFFNQCKLVLVLFLDRCTGLEASRQCMLTYADVC